MSDSFKQAIARKMMTAAINDYIDGRGWSVFPCKHNKRPYTDSGFKNASRDPKQVIEWWKEWPTATIGIPTGAANGFWALDVDQKDGKDGLNNLFSAIGEGNVSKEHFGLNQMTPTGGLHFLFEYDKDHPLKQAIDIFGPNSGVDIRTDGGYILVPPSAGSVNNEWVEYRWRDDSANPAPNPPWLNVIEKALENTKRSSSRVNLKDAVEKGLTKGQRDQELFRIACLLRSHDISQEMAMAFITHMAAKCRPMFDDGVAREKVESAYSYKNDPNNFMDLIRK